MFEGGIILKIQGEYQDSGIKGNIVPWALPRENIPVHVEWIDDIVYDEIQIKIPNDFKFVEFLNVGEVKILDNSAIINRVIKSPLLNTPTYFGFLVSSTGIYNELKVAKQISIDFLYEKNIIKSLTLYARIFRPSLEVTKEVDRIELTDEHEKCKLPIHLKYIGFGDIRLSISAEVGGKIVSHGESIIYELIRRLWLSENSPDEKIIIEDGMKRQISVDASDIRKITENLEKKIDSGDVSGVLEMIDDKDIENFKDWLSNVKNREKFSKVVYSRIEDLLLDLLSDLLDRHPTENVKLASAKTKIRARIKIPIEIIKIFLNYKDTLENEYPSIEIPIKIEDKRKEKNNTIIEIPITIEKWEEEPFKNVAEMEIEGGF